MDDKELVDLRVGDSVKLDERTAPYRYFDKHDGEWFNLSESSLSNIHRYKGGVKLYVTRIDGNNIHVRDMSGYSEVVDVRHLKSAEKKQENTMENVQTEQSVQSPITLVEAKANIGKTVYFIESSQPYSHSWNVWGDFEMNVNKMKDVIEGEIMSVDNEDVHVRYKTSFGDFDSSDFNPKHLSFTPLNQKGNVATGNPNPEIETPQTESCPNNMENIFTFKQMLKHIGNGGYAQVFTDKTANLAYHKWHDVREYAIGELEQYSKFRKVVQLDTPQNKTYLTKEDLISLLEQVK